MLIASIFTIVGGCQPNVNLEQKLTEIEQSNENETVIPITISPNSTPISVASTPADQLGVVVTNTLTASESIDHQFVPQSAIDLMEEVDSDLVSGDIDESFIGCTQKVEYTDNLESIAAYWRYNKDSDLSDVVFTDGVTTNAINELTTGGDIFGIIYDLTYIVATDVEPNDQPSKPFLSQIEIIYPRTDPLLFTISDEVIWYVKKVINEDYWLIEKYKYDERAPESSLEIFSPFGAEPIYLIDQLPNYIEGAPLSFSPDLKWVLYPEQIKDINRLVLLNLETMHIAWELPLTHFNSFAASMVYWHKDSSIVAIDYLLDTYIVDVSTGEHVSYLQMSQIGAEWTQVVSAISWHPTEHKFTFINNESILGIFDMDSMVAEKYCEWEGDAFFTSFWSPDGQYLLYVIRREGEDDMLFAYNTKTHVIIQIDATTRIQIAGWSSDSAWLEYKP